MQLYLPNGYADMAAIIRTNMPFLFCIGGRGTGKTYGALRYVLETGTRFCLMRRTQTQLDNIAKPETNPFKTIVRDMGLDWYCDPAPVSKNIYAFYRTRIQEDAPVHEDVLGYGVALSTISSLRSYDMSDVDFVIFDEFIPESHERSIKNESDAFFNSYESINRNRELQGRRPLQVLCMANSNDFASPILIGAGLVSTVENMIRKGRTDYINPQKGIGIFLLTGSPISNRKKQTALYKLTTGTAFEEMAINNAFAGSDDPDVMSVDLREYNPVVGLGEVMIYRHKSAATYYISAHSSGSCPRYSGDGIDMKRFFASYKMIMLAVFKGKVTYESHLVKALFLRYCGFN